MHSKFNSAALVCLLLLLGICKTFGQLTVAILPAGPDTICSGSRILMTGTGSGGTPPYQYAWSPGTELSSVNTDTTSASPLISTTYTVTVTDGLAATATASITLRVNPRPVATAGSNQTIQSCSPTGVQIGGVPTASGGTGPYTYFWSPVIGISSATISNPVVQGISTTITYTVLVTDHYGCTANSSVTVTANNSSPVVNITSSGNTTWCLGSGNTDNLTANVTGGAAPYQYVWGGSFISPTNAQIALVSPNPSGTYTYTVTVTDNGNCTTTANATVTVNPSPVIDSLPIHNVSCNGGSNGSACFYVSGGTPGYTYQWSNGATPQCISQLVAGTYTVTVHDFLSCSVTALVTVSQPAPINLTLTPTNTTCGQCNGQISLTISGGIPPYTYSTGIDTFVVCQLVNCNQLCAGNYVQLAWDANHCGVSDTFSISSSTGVTIDSVIAVNLRCYNDSTGSVCVYTTGGMPPYNFTWNNLVSSGSNCLTHLSIGGTYMVTVSSGDGCTASGSATVSIPAQLQELFNVTGVRCYGDSDGVVNLLASGGTPAYNYNWSNGETTRILTGVKEGSYRITITDAVGCTLIDSAYVTMPGQLYTSGVVHDVTCFGAQNGQVVLSVFGGTLPYMYAWSNGVTIDIITTEQGGNYFVTITDAHGCQVSSLYVIREPATLTLGVSATPALCFDSASGTVAALPVGGTLPYHYFWSNSATDSVQTGLPVGLYGLQLSDSNNCSASASANVSQPQALQINLVSQINNTCYGGNTGGLCTSASGGVTPYTYMWSSFQNSACINGLSVGTYFLLATDHNGCQSLDSFTITQPTQLSLLVNAPDSNAIPDSVNVVVTGGTPPYNYDWNDGEFTTWSWHFYMQAGIYLGAVTDTNGCSIPFRVDAGCSDSCVWPGDANYDGLVDNNDLLAIGLGYDSTGYARVYPTISFTPQYCQNWPDTLLGGSNYKHIDCNGDGVINADDTSAIVLNYNLTHPRGGSDQPWKSNAPVLHIKLSPDTLVDGQIATATFSLGDSALPCTNVYGLAFTYNFDPMVVDTSSVIINFGNSWLAGTGDHINISKTFYGPGQVQAALTRINHLNRSGYGPIGTVSMKITTGNINGKDLMYYLMNNFITRLRVIDNQGNVLPVNEGGDSVQVAFTPTNIIPLCCQAGIKIYPNPANNLLHITTNAITDIQEISIIDLTGREMFRQNMVTGSNFIINIADLSVGVYTINIKANQQEYHNRFVKVNVK